MRSEYTNCHGESVVLVSIPLHIATAAERRLQETQGITLQQALQKLASRVAYDLWWPDPNSSLDGHDNRQLQFPPTDFSDVKG